MTVGGAAVLVVQAKGTRRPRAAGKYAHYPLLLIDRIAER